MKESRMIEELTQDILTYMRRGESGIGRIVAENVKPEGLDERFKEYEKLMDFHFILKEKVVDFVKNLRPRLREVKTKTKNVKKTSKNGVEGRINWSSTVKERYSRNPKDFSLFVCENRSENYDIDENIVLKKLLSVIYRTLEDCEEYLKEDKNPVIKETWEEKEDLIEEMRGIFERNVHIQRIKKPERYEPTERMINSAENSRQSIYREAAKLINTRRKIFKGDKEEIKSLIENTAVKPDNKGTLFELFTLFRFIKIIENHEKNDFSLETIESNSQPIAGMSYKDKEIRLYHDSSGDKNLKFLYGEDDFNTPPSRPELVEKKATEVTEDYFKERKEEHSKRPDIIVLEIKSDESREYIVTEVKYSTNQKTIERGIKETLEYLAYMKYRNNWRFRDGKESIFGNDNGLLVIRDLDEDTEALSEQRTIKIFQTSDLIEDEGEKVWKILKSKLA